MRYKILIAVILLLTLFLRAYDIEAMPNWYWDEGVNLNTASNLVDGKAQQFALKYAWVPHPPLYFMVLVPLLKVVGDKIIALRVLSIAYSLMTVLVIYLVGKQMIDSKTGLVAALLYSVYPSAVFWSRMGFAHNQLMLLGIVTLYAVLKYANSGSRRFLYIACITAFLCFITEYSGIAFIMALLLYTHLYRRGEVKKVAVITVGLLSAYTMLMVFLYERWFIQDIWFNFGRVNIFLLFIGIIILLVLAAYPHKFKNVLKWFHLKVDKVGIHVFMFYLPLTLIVLLIPPSDKTLIQPIDYLWLVGVIGLMFIGNEERRNTTWVFYISYLAIIAAYDRSDHMVMPLYPIMSLGGAIFLLKLFYSRDRIFSFISGKTRPFLITTSALTLIFYPILIMAYQDVDSFILGNNFKTMPLDEVEKLNSFINNRVTPEDIVLTQSYFSQGLKSKTTILSHAISYGGKAIFYYPAFDAERFSYNTSIKNVKYAVLPKGMIEALSQIGHEETAAELGRWPVVYETDTLEEVEIPEIYYAMNKMRGIDYRNQMPVFQVLENPSNL